MLSLTKRITRSAAYVYTSAETNGTACLHALLVRLLLCKAQRQQATLTNDVLGCGVVDADCDDVRLISDHLHRQKALSVSCENALVQCLHMLLHSPFPADFNDTIAVMLWFLPYALTICDTHHPFLPAMSTAIRSTASLALHSEWAQYNEERCLLQLMSAGARIPFCEKRQGLCHSVLIDVAGSANGTVIRTVLEWIWGANGQFNDKLSEMSSKVAPISTNDTPHRISILTAATASCTCTYEDLLRCAWCHSCAVRREVLEAVAKRRARADMLRACDTVAVSDEEAEGGMEGRSGRVCVRCGGFTN